MDERTGEIGKAGEEPLRQALRRVSLLADLAEAEIDWLAEHAEEIHLADGEVTTREGEPADRMSIVLAGELMGRRERGAEAARIFIARAGEITGILPFSRMRVWPSTVRAVGPTRLAAIPAARFAEMLAAIPVLEPRLIGVMTDRARETTRIEQQNEKLLALGKLSAGLAHELNNPASALGRAVAELRDRIAALPSLTSALIRQGVEPAQMETLCRLHSTSEEGAGTAGMALDPLAQADRESAVSDWLEDRQVKEAWRLAPTFVASGMTAGDLESFAAGISAAVLPATLAWVESGIALHLVLGEMENATRRISGLVGAVKEYSHMDRELTEKTATDLHRSLDSTLTMFSHKAKVKQVKVRRDYDPQLPAVHAFAGELNQVWTNLLDNAFDAVAIGGSVSVCTRLVDGQAEVVIADDGPGIPAELLTRIWEPFFTTKPLGEGSGLGLDIARRIVVGRHGGEMRLESRPGDTRFLVTLPIGAHPPVRS
ncbi:MAG: cyclic nucleotide-binding domain-containing protein [Acidobacteria bacterium]|nr:cyclic nucleotide-binding domain-containing protein [Acidobacteriota bacterium]